MTPRKDCLGWLTQSSIPAIVYQAMRDLPVRAGPAQIRVARKRVLHSGAVPAILARQAKGGSWKIDRDYYGPKYFSSHWSMMLLAELGAEKTDPRFRLGAEYMLGTTAQELRDCRDRKVYDWACFWGNLLRYSLQAGFREDPRIGEIIRHLSISVRRDCRCKHQSGEVCAWGTVRALWGLAAVPRSARAAEWKRAVRHGVRFLLEDHRLEQADYPVPRGAAVNPLWFKMNFPLFYQVDILFTLRVLDELDGLDHRGAQSALDWLEARRRPDGRWKGSSPYRRRTWSEMGTPAETDRWVSLQALRILRHAGRKI
jgi:hypothetical protein